MAGPLLAAAIPGLISVGGSLLGSFLNRGASKAQNQATAEMTNIAKGQAELQRQQAALTLPFQKNLFSALQQRANRRMPRVMERSFRGSNPYANVKRVSPNFGLGKGGSPFSQGLGRSQRTEQGKSQRFDPRLLIALFLLAKQQRQQPSAANPMIPNSPGELTGTAEG
jgi:hypothetical protein